MRLLGLVYLLFLFNCDVGRVGAQDFWELVPTQSDASLRGLYAIDRTTAWACGSQGTLIRTIDGGKSWARLRIEGLDDKIELRSIHAWSPSEAIVATAGSPCRIYYTKDSGLNWKVVYENSHVDAFIDGMRFWDDRRGFAFGDPIDGKLMAIVSQDRGQSWQAPAEQDYPLGSGEAGFAASNSSLMLYGSDSLWIGLGGGVGPAQVLMSDDLGRTWARSPVGELPAGKSSGIFSLARSSEGKVVAVGGDYMQADVKTGNIALYDPGQGQWRKPEGRGPGGYRSSVIYLESPIRHDEQQASVVRWICVGPNGCDGSEDAQDWFPLSSESFHSLARASDGSIWACGARGCVGVRVP